MLSRSTTTAWLTLALPLLAAAHFDLVYPPSRGATEDDLSTGPCGGKDTPSVNRTLVSTTSFALLLDMGHDQSAVQILLGLGNDPGSNFNITVTPTFREEGLGDFCLPQVALPSGMGIMDGMNATLQVVTNGDPSGGLYNCADITFTTATVEVPSTCANGTGVTAVAFPSDAAARNANESTPQGGAQSGSGSGSSSSAASSASGSATAAASSTPTGGAAAMSATWGGMGLLMLGAAALL